MRCACPFRSSTSDSRRWGRDVHCSRGPPLRFRLWSPRRHLDLDQQFGVPAMLFRHSSLAGMLTLIWLPVLEIRQGGIGAGLGSTGGGILLRSSFGSAALHLSPACCLACCLARVICRCRRRVQAASRRRGLARRERRIDSERLTPGLPAQGRGGKSGTRVAPEKDNDPPRRAIRNIQMILQPPRATRSLVPSEEN